MWNDQQTTSVGVSTTCEFSTFFLRIKVMVIRSKRLNCPRKYYILLLNRWNWHSKLLFQLIGDINGNFQFWFQMTSVLSSLMCGRFNFRFFSNTNSVFLKDPNLRGHYESFYDLYCRPYLSYFHYCNIVRDGEPKKLMFGTYHNCTLGIFKHSVVCFSCMLSIRICYIHFFSTHSIIDLFTFCLFKTFINLKRIK